MVYHIPALLNESIGGLNIQADGVYVDVTFGGGGHSRAILEVLERGRLIAFDQDADAAMNRPADGRFVFLQQNFRYLKNNLRYLNINQIDGLIADLGVSFHQFDEAGRGFTFRADAPLDMRMNREHELTAAGVLERYTEEQLKNLFREYGEIRGAHRLAALICRAREEKPVHSSGRLREALAPVIPPHQESKFLAKVFQALRIEVNREMESLKDLLRQSTEMIRPGGRLVVITYHSLEDRLVKNFIRSGKFSGEAETDLYGHKHTPFEAVNRRVIVPTEAETQNNKRARSARLRIAERTQYGTEGD